jgi:hypothetical protein
MAIQKPVKKPHQKSQTKRPVRKVKPEAKMNAEVMVFDVLQKEYVVAEYRNETKQWYGTKLYKVYHPAFKEREDMARFVPTISYLGPLPEGAPMVSPDETFVIRGEILN